MKKTDVNSELITKILIGSVVAIGGITLLLAFRRNKNGSLNNFGETISHLSEILENHHIEEPEIMKKLGKKFHQQEASLLEVADWVATGINLWKKLKN